VNTLNLNEHRCPCGKLLLKGIFFDAIFEIKCKKCGRINKIGHIKLATEASQYLIIINNQGIITNVGDSVYDSLGYDCSELIGKNFTEIDPTILKELGKKLLESVLTENNFFLFDTVHQTKTGRKIPVSVRLKLYQPNDQDKYVLVLAKIKNANAETFNKNESEFLENICDFYFDIDTNGVGESVGPSVEKLFGFSSKSVIGKNYFDFTPPETREEFRRMFQHFSANSLPFRIENKAGLNNECEIIRNKLYFTPKHDDQGKFVGYRVLGWVIKNT
jgi:PAS domain S-box-containing protein